jgi:hypothetical protein
MALPEIFVGLVHPSPPNVEVKHRRKPWFLGDEIPDLEHFSPVFIWWFLVSPPALRYIYQLHPATTKPVRSQ